MTQLIPNGKQQFVDINGRPLLGGKVYFYSVGTNTPKNTYQDVDETILNTNPVILDARGQASIYGTGRYRQVVRGADDVLIWDQIILDPSDIAQSFVSELAADLANATDPLKGSAMIGHEGGTVDTALDGLNASVAANAAAISAGLVQAGNTNKMFSNTLEPGVVDLHFGTLQGVGWTDSEPGAIVVHTVTASTTITISLNNVAGLYPGQLICYLGTDGEYYTSVIKLIGTTTLTFAFNLPCPVAVGAPLYNFYRDDAHANTYGFNAVVDDALRQLRLKRLQRMEYQAKDTAIWSPVLGATVATQGTTSYLNPGAAAIGERGILVSGTTVNSGVVSSWAALTGGDYVTNIVLNPMLRTGGFSGFVDVAVDELTADGVTQTVALTRLTPTWGGIISLNMAYSLSPGSSVRLRVTSPNGGPWTFYVGMLTHYRVGGFLNTLNRGRHVLLGDSWFSPGADFSNRLRARLDKATIIDAGIPGNLASELIARFATDVVPQNPDYVWIMVGTNDYYASVSNRDFEQQIIQLRKLIQEIGAQPIFFTPTVGAISYVPEQLTKSRSMAINTRYVGQEIQPNGPGNVLRNFTFCQTVTVAASATVILAVAPGNTRAPAIARFLALSAPGINLGVLYSATTDGAGGVDATSFVGVGPYKDQLAPRTDTTLRFIALRAVNTTGSPITATIVADICWQQSLV